MTSEKKKGLEERVVALFGRTAYKDVRQGVGGTAGQELNDQDLAAALGVVMTRKGKIAVQALETQIARTEIHLEDLLRAWEDRQAQWLPNEKDKRAWRWGAFLAARELAGARTSRTLFAQLAYNNQMRRQTLELAVADALQWMQDIAFEARVEFRNVCRDDALMFELRRARTAARANGDRRRP